jgi:predicted MFS family arabinose efflux permease
LSSRHAPGPPLDDPSGLPDDVAQAMAGEGAPPPPQTGPPPRRGLVAALVYCGLCTSVVGSLGALLIPTISEQQNVSRGTAQWVLTAALLVGAVATPVLGALSDRPTRRTVLLCTLGLVLLGSVLAATAQSFPQLVIGRAMQGLTYGVIPMATATARAHLGPDRVRSAVAALSVTTVTGAGLSFPLTGLIVQVSNYRVAFWFAVGFTALALGAVLLTVPGRDPSAAGRSARLDWPGAALLAGGLASLLLAVSQGDEWGWSSPGVVGLFASAAVLFLLWTWHELRTARPLVQLRTLANRDVALANVSALGLGAMLFAGSSAVSQLAQTPRSTGYGFGLGLLLAGLALMPSSIGSQVSNRFVQVLARRIPIQRMLPVGPALICLDMTFLTFFHDQLWQVYSGMFVQGLAIGASFVVMPTMILAAVPPEQTGSAVALNQVLRTLGGSIGSATVGALLAAATLRGELLPAEHGYTLAFAGTAVGCVLLALVLLLAPALHARRDAATRTAPVV